MNVKILGRSELEEVPASVKETVHHLFDRHFAYYSGQDAYYEEDGRDFVNVEAKLYHAESYGDESAKKYRQHKLLSQSKSTKAAQVEHVVSCKVYLAHRTLFRIFSYFSRVEIGIYYGAQFKDDEDDPLKLIPEKIGSSAMP